MINAKPSKAMVLAFGNQDDNFNDIPQSILEVQVGFPLLEGYCDLSWVIQI